MPPRTRSFPWDRRLACPAICRDFLQSVCREVLHHISGERPQSPPRSGVLRWPGRPTTRRNRLRVACAACKGDWRSRLRGRHANVRICEVYPISFERGQYLIEGVAVTGRSRCSPAGPPLLSRFSVLGRRVTESVDPASHQRPERIPTVRPQFPLSEFHAAGAVTE